MFQNLVKMNVNFISNQLKITDEDKIDEIRYGVETILGEVFKLTVIFLVSLYINKEIEFIVVFLLFSNIRTAIGGSHAKSLMGCLVQSLLLFLALYYIADKIPYIPLLIEVTVIPSIIFVLSTVKYKTKIDQSGNDEIKNKKLRLKLIIKSLIALIISRIFFINLYNLIFITLVSIIIDYLRVRREELC